MAKISRRAYAEMFGPTVGDRVRLADTDLIVEVEDGEYGFSLFAFTNATRESFDPVGPAAFTVTAGYAFTDTNDVTSVAQTAADNSDVIYIPTDNTAASNTEAIANVVIPAKVPVVAGEEGICSGCGVATLSISYYDLGYATGEMAAKILADGADVSAMPVEFAPNVTKKYNAANCEALGITPPSDYVAIG